MTWSLFAKKVEDEDMCFMRDILSVAGAVSDVTGIQPMKKVIQKFLIDNGLWNKFVEFEKIQSSSIIKDCYPLDKKRRYNHAEKLLSLINKFNFNDDERNYVLYQTLKIISQMSFSKEEKEMLIKTYVLRHKINNKELENFITEQYLDTLNSLSN